MHGLNSQVNYTWSHSIDTASDGEDYVPNAAQPDNSLNPAAEKANSNFDSRNRFTWDFNYNIPSGSTHHALTSGWSLNGLLRLSSGQPYNLNSFEDFNGSNQFFERPDVIGDPFAGTSTPGAILNLERLCRSLQLGPGGRRLRRHQSRLPLRQFAAQRLCGPKLPQLRFFRREEYEAGRASQHGVAG